MPSGSSGRHNVHSFPQISFFTTNIALNLFSFVAMQTLGDRVLTKETASVQKTLESTRIAMGDLEMPKYDSNLSRSFCD
jgi:hypothetical protein